MKIKEAIKKLQSFNDENMEIIKIKFSDGKEILEEKAKPWTIEIGYDEGYYSPRENCNIGTIIGQCKYQGILDKSIPTFGTSQDSLRVYFVDECDDIDEDDKEFIKEFGFDEKEELREKVDNYIDENVIYLPVYLYDHGGITISTSKFSCSWDSGQIGYIYVTREKLKEEIILKENEDLYKKGLQILESEIKELDYFCTGEIYYYKIKDANDITIESEYGFFGLDNLKDYLKNNYDEKDFKNIF